MIVVLLYYCFEVFGVILITSNNNFIVVVRTVDCIRIYLNPAVCGGDYAVPTYWFRAATDAQLQRSQNLKQTTIVKPQL